MNELNECLINRLCSYSVDESQKDLLTELLCEQGLEFALMSGGKVFLRTRELHHILKVKQCKCGCTISIQTIPQFEKLKHQLDLEESSLQDHRTRIEKLQQELHQISDDAA